MLFGQIVFLLKFMTHISQKTVLYIPGFLSGNDSQTEMLHALGDIFPSSYNISSLPWEMKTTNEWHLPWESKSNFSFSDSWNNYLSKTGLAVNSFIANKNALLSKALFPLELGVRWVQALESAKKTAEAIAKSLLCLSEEEREKIILVGHSLGANIVINILYKLSLKRVRIWKALLLGAAMDNNDAIIRPACNAVKDKIVSVINIADYILGIYSLINSKHALGRGFKGLINRQQFLEISTDPFPEHASLFYLQQLQKKTKSL